MIGNTSSECVTDGIRVEAAPAYVPEHSHPACNQYDFAFQILIRNEGDQSVRLVSRHWVAIDADGERQDVQGDGVGGRRPVLEPGEEFEYINHCSLTTKWGTLEGEFVFELPNGTRFSAPVKRIYLTAARRAI